MRDPSSEVARSGGRKRAAQKKNGPTRKDRPVLYKPASRRSCGATSERLSHALVRAVFLACSRKEVIQPQVPLRLPCYDFAPVTKLAFGRSLPCGLGHGLRALPAPMA